MFTPGVMVRIVEGSGPLGLLHSPGDYKFIEACANPGDLCETVEYDGPLPDGWMMVLHLETNTFCPVSTAMVERA